MEKSDRFSSRAARVPRNRPDLRLPRALCIAAIFSVIMQDGFAGAPRPSGSLVPTRSEVIATQGMAATSHPLVSQVALDVLKRGGTAVDAAIAANATMGLMEPTGNGVGGDLFAIVWDAKTQKLYGLNGSGRSPKSLSLKTLRAELKKLNSSTIPPHRPAAGVGAGRRSMAGSSCTQIRQAAHERAAGAGDFLCAQRISRHGSHCRGLAAQRASALEVPGLCRHLHAQRPRTGQGRGISQSAAREHAQRDRRRRARRILQR